MIDERLSTSDRRSLKDESSKASYVYLCLSPVWVTSRAYSQPLKETGLLHDSAALCQLLCLECCAMEDLGREGCIFAVSENDQRMSKVPSVLCAINHHHILPADQESRL